MGLLRSCSGDIVGGDKLALDDLFGGEPPRPLLLRLLERSAKLPRFAGQSRQQRLALARYILGADAGSWTFGLRVRGSPEERYMWAARLEELNADELVEEVVMAAVK